MCTVYNIVTSGHVIEKPIVGNGNRYKDTIFVRCTDNNNIITYYTCIHKIMSFTGRIQLL